jgi:RNA polymerase primary sigma factor
MDMHSITKDTLAILPPMEARVLRLRFGIGLPTDHTIKETAQIIGVAPEQVEMIENEALRKLKHPLNREVA